MESGASILVVDDEPQVLLIMSRMLEMDGYKVFSAADGQEALGIAADTPLHAAVVDIQMPGMSGLETIRKLREMQPELNVLVLTGQAGTQEEAEALRLGAAGIVWKPFVSRVRTLLSMLADKTREAPIAGDESTVDVLVIDDDERIRELLERYLRGQGHSVEVAASGEEGLEIVKKRKVDVAVIDIVMQPMDGLHTYRAIREISPETKAIMITGFGDADVSVLERGDRLKQALEEGAVGYLKKPIELARLGEAIKELTSGKSAE